MLHKKLGVLAFAAVVSVAACSSSAATVQPTTPPSTASVDPGTQASAAATVAPTTAPTPTPAPATPAPTPTPMASQPAAQPSESAPGGAAPVDYTGAIGADPCTGSDTNKAYLLDTAKQLKFDLYCAVLPKGWTLKNSFFNVGAKGAYFEAIYASKSKVVKLQEGTVCGLAGACDVDSPVSAAYFGTLSANLYDKGTSLLVGARLGENPAWVMTTSGGVTQAEALSFGAALYKVPAA